MPLPLLSLLPSMVSEIPKIMPQTNTSSNPSVNAGMIPFVGGIVSTITDIYKSKKEQEAYDKAVKTQAKQMKKAAEEQRLALARARAQQTVDMALQLSTQRRQEQEMMLMIVGGVALVAAGVFLFSAFKKKPTAASSAVPTKKGTKNERGH